MAPCCSIKEQRCSHGGDATRLQARRRREGIQKQNIEELNCNAFTFRGKSICIFMVMHSDGLFCMNTNVRAAFIMYELQMNIHTFSCLFLGPGRFANVSVSPPPARQQLEGTSGTKSDSATSFHG